jgi:hypothetical protein
VNTVSGDVDDLQAKYGVEIDNNGIISGFQLLSGAGTPSAFNVRADQFNIYSADGTTSDLPFSVFTSSRTVDGVVYPAGTYMDDVYVTNSISLTDENGDVILSSGTQLDGGTYIQDLSVDTLQIANQAVTFPRYRVATAGLYLPESSGKTLIDSFTFTVSGYGSLIVDSYIYWYQTDATSRSNSEYATADVRLELEDSSGTVIRIDGIDSVANSGTSETYTPMSINGSFSAGNYTAKLYIDPRTNGTSSGLGVLRVGFFVLELKK